MMKVSRPNDKPLSAEELQDLDTLKTLIERAVADGVISHDEIDCIRAFIRADGKISPEELNLCQELVWSKIESGELVYSW